MTTYQHPDCTEDPAACRVTVRHWISTLLAWEPQYDGNGMQVNADPNTAVNEMTCATCARVWQTETQAGVTTTRWVAPLAPPPSDL
jgi:hypothetical protein